MMVSSIRSISTALPRISMARIPLVAFTNTHVSPAITASQTKSHAHATSAHPSAYSSMPSSRKSNSKKFTNAADKLEKSAEGLSKAAKDYIREGLSPKTSSSRLSQHASDAIRMVESHSILKQDEAPVHDVSDEDPTEKPTRYQKRH